MNICIIATYTTEHILGGREIHIKELAEGLVEKGYNVAILTTKHPNGITYKEDGGVKYYYFKRKRPSLFYNRLFLKEFAKFFEEINEKEKFDVIHSLSPIVLSLIKKRGYHEYIPIVITLQGTTSINELKNLIKSLSLKSFLLIPFLLKDHFLDAPLIFKNSDKIITVNTILNESVKKQYKVPDEKLAMIPNGIDTEKFKPNLNISELKRKYGINDEKVILCAGNLNKYKGIQYVIRIFSSLKDSNMALFIVGTGDYLSELKKLSEKLNISNNIIFTGKVPNQELPKYYNLADVFVMPTMLLEGLPLVVLEAMACGKPVIAHRIGGIPTVIDNYEDGVLVEPGDLKELEEKILNVLNDNQLSKKLGENARKKIVEKFSLKGMIENTIKVYEEVLTK